MADAETSESAHAAVGGAAQRVLLVDDDTAVRTFAARALANRGYAVTAAANGEEALRLLDDGAGAEIVVTDIVMPGMDGLALARTLRQRQPGLPVILMTGYAEAAQRSELEAAPALTLLTKPFRLHTLCDSVAARLGDPA
ncbi:two-component system, cell cycle sensor histidine kinase and response regulator CckA [Limimonas halophila]|uniref:Two-component system, cell cycle sensor histidine kinase and response regulator CckA n=1 Tax=Limimonas halophila TaxID=1082479 RepID=A0A1G7TT05_9PROT|nr:response regulator [Limimonas halophila]SDG38407.1 two-component system, cell cycle sensor histidine kinase and response regulator CckA [Limimonas halophila]